jgi:hypothetical protein
MNQYAKNYQSARRANRWIVRVRTALCWVGLGFVLHAAFTWNPRRDAAAPAAHRRRLPITASALQGRQIRIASTLPVAGGEPDRTAAAWLQAVLASAGARVSTWSGSPGDTSGVASADLILVLAPAPAGSTAGLAPRFLCPPEDTTAERLGRFVSAGMAAELGLPLLPPVPSRAVRRAEAPVLKVEFPQGAGTQDDIQAQAGAFTRALSRYFIAVTPPPSPDTSFTAGQEH